MLAQNFLTADELGLTEKGRDALIRVLGIMDRGELVDVVQGLSYVPNGFAMNRSWSKHECGTVGCIGGWAGYYSQGGMPDPDFTNGGRNRLGELFCPCGWNIGRYKLGDARHALRTYLVTGVPDWS